MKANSCLQIDLSAVRDNVLQIRKEIGPGVKLIPVLKGNAYGLGACKLADILGDIDGIDIFAVSHVAEGIELRKAGIRQRILGNDFTFGYSKEYAGHLRRVALRDSQRGLFQRCLSFLRRTNTLSSERAVNYHADKCGTSVVYETVAKAVGKVRNRAPLEAYWSEDIERDYRSS